MATAFPTYYYSDIQSRIMALSKMRTDCGELFLTSMIEYVEYNEEALCLILPV